MKPSPAAMFRIQQRSMQSRYAPKSQDRFWFLMSLTMVIVGLDVSYHDQRISLPACPPKPSATFYHLKNMATKKVSLNTVLRACILTCTCFQIACFEFHVRVSTSTLASGRINTNFHFKFHYQPKYMPVLVIEMHSRIKCKIITRLLQLLSLYCSPWYN